MKTKIVPYLPELTGGEVVTGPLVGESVGSVPGAEVVGSTVPSPMKEQLKPL